MEKEASKQSVDETAAADEEENSTGADAFKRVELHKQIKEAMRDYRKSTLSEIRLSLLVRVQY